MRYTRKTWKEARQERRFYISSLPDDAEKPGGAIHAHWSMENNLYWMLNVNLRDHDCRIRKNNIPANFTAVERAIVNALKEAPL